MTFKIGFNAETKQPQNSASVCTAEQVHAARKSVVQVHFAARNMTLAYYNDRFDLQCGDWVYVDGKLEGLLGQVVKVTYHFKIRLSDYKRVIFAVDTRVRGKFFMAGTHFVAFDRAALPYAKAAAWFIPPKTEGEEFVSGDDDEGFPLCDLSKMEIGAEVFERGRNYYLENRVQYLCLDGTHGRAVVEGREGYEVEFEYRNGQIENLVCSCFCSCHCKHELAVMLQLRETLEKIEKEYAEEYQKSGYFAAIGKGTFFSFAVNGKEKGSFVL